ncbi:probable maleylacetoacetate isomerase 2 [Paramacrobiotus metropolitanus]|uniref:probable maleylacetoacetate isomerase 2 n=1 Tax=Paramacrobiotus metropolitanus TaxID=2943436 RepID=UPI002445EC04|nr:probable maleylacetoacetate isomerase 2 [Paramacrobiotus metropolitanus]
MTGDEITLYAWYRSSSSWRVRLALNLKQIPYKLIPIDLEKGGQIDPAFLRLNPKGQVPVLQIDGEVLTQSVAILEYLEETRPQHPLLPKDPYQRAEVRRLVQTITAGIQPHQVLTGLYLPDHVPVEWNFARSLDWAGHWIEKGFAGLETMLAQTSGKYCVGDAVTLADCCLVPQVYNAKLRHVDLDPYPTIRRVFEALSELEPFKKAHPSAQPDCTEEYKKVF